jgi:hypothetical protein
MTNRPPTFVLPGSWGRINLASEAATQRSVRKVLEHVTRRRDDMADTRQKLRQRIEKAADTARGAGATDFYLAFSLTPKVPLPAWISVFTPTIESTDFDALGLGELRSFLDAGTRQWGPDGAAVTTGDVSPDDGPIHVVRHSWRRTVDVVEGDAEQSFDFVEADYWLAAANPNRIALLTFSTALAEYEEEMLSLFDAVVSTIRWPAPGPAAASVA